MRQAQPEISSGTEDIAVPISIKAAERYYRYAGALHIHTTYSDGSGSFQDVANEAHAAGLDFFIATDHNTLKPLKDGHQRYWGSTLALIGTEISANEGHFLALDLPGDFEWNERDAQSLIRQVNESGGFGIIAHPLSAKSGWKDWSVTGFAGMEIVNLVSLAEEKLRKWSPLKLGGRCLFRMLYWFYVYYTRPNSLKNWILRSAIASETELWDRLLSESSQPLFAVAGADAHARIKIGKWGLKTPSYRHAFESAQTYAVTLEPLSGDADADRRLIYDAFKSGRIYAVCPRSSSAHQFNFIAQEGDREVTMGQRLELNQQARLVVDAPNSGRTLIRLLRDGKEVTSVQGDRLVWNATIPGTYRAETYEIASDAKSVSSKPGESEIVERVRMGELSPWIFSNPIRLDPVPATNRQAKRDAGGTVSARG